MARKWDKLSLLVVFVLMATRVVMADQDFRVTGIMMGDQPIAIVNGQTVTKGGQVDGAEVVEIGNDSVVLKFQGNLIVRKIVTAHIQNVQPISFQHVAENKIIPYKDDSNASFDATSSEQESSKIATDDYSSVSSSDVKDIRVSLYEEAGSISGYIIFYDEKGKECRVKTTEGSDREAVLYTGSTFFAKNKINLQITPVGFEELSLRGGGRVLGFPIEEFYVSKKISGFIFEWNNFKKEVPVE